MLYKWTADKVGSIVLETATIAAAWTTIANSADAALIGGKIVWVYATSANTVDAYLETATISATWVLTVTVSSAMTAEVVYTVAILRATGNDA
jgi:hypothetical protein